MCRSIKKLRNPGHSVSPEELQQAALQFVRKITGFQKPSKSNQEAFYQAVFEIAASSDRLLHAIGSSVARTEDRFAALTSEET